MSRTRLVVAVSMVALMVEVAAATERVGIFLVPGDGFRALAPPKDVSPAASGSGNPGQQPSLYSGLPEPICDKLERAFSLAIEHLEHHETCKGLFYRFDADGIHLLNRTVYVPLTATERRRFCGGGTVAVSSPGRAVIGPCPVFSRLSDRRAAVTLIHEALHAAGQPEAPIDPGAPTSFDITRMVIASCGF